MIGQLRGTVAHLEPHDLILDVAGVGYRIAVADHMIASASLGSELTIFTHLAVRENALDLYGFESERERDFFEMLIGVSGVGPKSALGILSLAPVATLMSAIGSGDASYLTKVSGIGPKSAQKIVLELADKLAVYNESSEETRQGTTDALDALHALGYSVEEARRALQSISDDISDPGERVKEALKQLL